jgi:hypothetical protein
MPAEKLYVLVRNDLPPGQQAVQGMHALADFAGEHPEHFHPWNKGSNTLVLLGVTEKELRDAIVWCDTFDYAYTMFRESDINDALTAVAFQPDRFLAFEFASYSLALSNLPKKRWWQHG